MQQGSTSDVGPLDAGPSRARPSGAGTPDVGAGPSAPVGPSGAGTPDAGAGPSAPAGPSGAGPSAPSGPSRQPARTPRGRRIPQGTSIRRRPRERRKYLPYTIGNQRLATYYFLSFFFTLSGVVNSYLNTC